MSDYNSASVKDAVNLRHNFDLSTDTLTTLDFFKMIPLRCQLVMPGGSYNIDYSSRIRVMPLNKPMFANMYCTFRSFFVPMRVIFSHWNAFITDTVENNKKYNNVPYFDVLKFISEFLSDPTIAQREHVHRDEGGKVDVAYDYIVNDYDNPIGQQTVLGVVLTRKGRRIVQLLHGLGYNLPFGYQQGEETGAPQDYGQLSLLPILAYGKIVCDWFCMPSYSDKINSIQAAIDTISNTVSSSYSWSSSPLQILITLCLDLHYSDDLFVSAWDNPVSPNGTTSSSVTISDVTVNAQGTQYKSKVQSSVSGSPSTYDDTSGTPIIRAESGTTAVQNLSQYILNALQKLTSYIRRNQVAGYRPLDRYLLRYGKKLDSEKLKRSVFIHSDKVTIGIGEVMSQSDTFDSGGQSLGDYAGVGYGQGSSKYSWQSDEFGFLIDCCYIMPYVRYFEGTQPHTMAINRFHFFTPEFDGMGCEGIPSKQVYFGTINSQVNDGVDGLVPYNLYPTSQNFGFAPRYYGVKTNCWSVVSGDFRFNSRNVGYDQWHMFRYINTISLSSQSWKHSQWFTEGSADAKQYDRVFQITDGENDGFILGVHFNVKANLPAREIFDDLILDSDPDAEHQSEKRVNVGGTRMQ